MTAPDRLPCRFSALASPLIKSWPRIALAALALGLCAPAGWTQRDSGQPSSAPRKQDADSDRKALESESARKMVQDTIDAISEVLRNEENSQEKKRGEFIDLVEPKLDMESICLRVLPRDWDAFERKQKNIFSALFRKFLLLLFWRQVEGEAFESITILSDRRFEGFDGDWEVTTRIQQDAKKARIVELRLRRADDPNNAGDWKIVEMEYGKKKQVASRRSDFEQLVKNRGEDGIIAWLREEIANMESLPEDPPKSGSRD